MVSTGSTHIICYNYSTCNWVPRFDQTCCPKFVMLHKDKAMMKYTGQNYTNTSFSRQVVPMYTESHSLLVYRIVYMFD